MTNERLKQQAVEAMRKDLIGVMATASKGCLPWTSVVHFLVDDSLNFYFMTRRSTLKYKNIIANNGNIAFNVGLASGGKNGNFQIAGKAAPLRANEDWQKFLGTMFSQRQINDLHMSAREDDPFFGLGGRDYVVVILKPKFIRWLRVNGNKPTFTVVLP